MARTKQTARNKRKNVETEQQPSEEEKSATKPKQQKQQQQQQQQLPEHNYEPIQTNSKGFLITYDGGTADQHPARIAEAISIFNTYADKVHQSEDGKKCCFKHKLVGQPHSSQIFIETDMSNPSVLVDSIYADLQTVNPSETCIEAVKKWIRLLPVDTTCAAEHDDILQSVRNLVEPLLADSGGSFRFKVALQEVASRRKMNMNKGYNVLYEKISKYVTSRACGARKDDADAIINVKSFDEVSCVSLLRKFREFKGYSVVKVLNEKNEQQKKSLSEGVMKSGETPKGDEAGKINGDV